MRNDYVKQAFTAAVDGATLADIDVSDAYEVAIIVDIDSQAGTQTNTTIFAVPFVDQELGIVTGGQNIRKTIDIVAGTGIFYLDRHDTAIVDPAFENVFQRIRVKAALVGVGHTITGSIYIFKKYAA